MKLYALLVCIAIIALSSIADATPGDVLKETKIEFTHPTGIAWDGKSFWVADRKTDTFYRLDPATGKVGHSLESPGYFPSGLAWDGELLWSTDPGEGKIYATDVKTGHTVRTLDSPTPSPMGIAWDGTYLWICDNRKDKILRIDPADGTTIVSFPSPATDPRGLTFDGAYLWCSDRIRDQIYMIHPENGLVILILEAPGPFPWGLTWRKDHLVNTDYQRDGLFEIVTRDEKKFKTSEPRVAVVDFTTEAFIFGTGDIPSLDIYYAVPSERDNQSFVSPLSFSPDPGEYRKDIWGQKVAVFEFSGLKPSESVEVSMKAEIETSAIRYFIYPDRVGDDIPGEIRKKYLVNDIKYDYEHPYIQKIVGSIAGDETNLYWKARKLYQYLIANMEYELAGGWNTAPTVLKRKNGSCSEYSFSFIALCRAAGIPARYVGALVVRGDDASYDEVFHRWNEIFLPGYGWIPVDANAGDRKLPADQAAAFGGISNRFLVTTEGGGNSEYLEWGYNHNNKWISTGKCRVKVENIAEWEPLEK